MTIARSAKILVVDDEPANIVLLNRCLDQQYHVKSAGGGRTALDMIAREPFDLVLLDIMMPRVNGFEVLRTMRSDENTADIPVILISALTESQYIVQGLERGANDYITKPIEPEIVTARVHSQVRLKQLQDERKAAFAELQSLHAMKDRFLRMASHDLKNPLANMALVNHLLRERHADDAKTLDLLDLSGQAAETMQSVIGDFLDTAVLESGQLDLKFEPVRVMELLWAASEQFKLKAAKKQIKLKIEIAEGIVFADRARLMQIVENLVSNAIKYSPEGGTVTLVSQVYEGVVRIAVADEGQGIPLEEQPRLFTQFGKLSPRPTDGESSTGLGLWIVKHMVTLQGGVVGVESAPGQGSLFWVDLPAVMATELAGVM